MRIIFVNHWARDIGGAECSLIDLMAAMAGRDDVHLVTSEEGPLVEKAAALGVTTHVLAGRFSLYRVKRDSLVKDALHSAAGLVSYGWFVIRLAGLIRQLRPEVVHANVPKSHVALFGAQLLGFRQRAVFHVREIFRANSMAYRVVGVALSKPSSRVIAISHAVRASLLPAVQSRAVVIHNGVALPAFSSRGPAGSTIRCVYLGRVVPWKGCHLLIKALARLATISMVDVRLDIIGDTLYWDAHYRDELALRIADNGLGNRCRLLPHTNEPYETLSRYDIFCIASFEEPFGRVVAEAQACALPVVGFDSGGIAEIVEQRQTGMLVPYGDINAFAGALKSLAENKQLITSMGLAGHARVQKLFNRDIQMPKIAAYLHDTAAEQE